ncbi:MFS transporter [Brochothrix campestris]|uniref:MFS transporter n=1 Tax=Brochothrix campestris TaxID=2757 RepID=UPI0038CF9365
MEKERLFTGNFIATSVVNFVLTLSMYLMLVTMASYAMSVYHASTSLGGLVASIFIIGSVIGRLLAGRLINQLGLIRMLWFGMALFLVMTLCYFFATSLVSLMVVRFFHGLGFGVATTATGTIISLIIPASRAGEGIGYFSLSTVVSTAIGPLIGIAMMNRLGFTSIFTFSFIIGVLCLIAMFFVKAPPLKKVQSLKGFKLSDYVEKSALPIALVMFFMALGYSSVLSFMTNFTAELKMIQAGSLYFLIYALIVLISRPFSGRLLDSRGANVIVYPSLLLFALGFAILSQATTMSFVLLAALIMGLGYGNFQSTTQALAVKLAPKERMGLANSTYFICLDLGYGIGPFLLGYIIPASGFHGVYLGLACYVLLGMGLYYVLHGRKERQST